MPVHKHFEKLGFSKNEERVYLALAEMGKASGGLIAKRCKFPRSTAYSILDVLVAKKLVSFERARGASYYTINKPNALMHMVKREQEQLAHQSREKLDAAAELAELLGTYFQNENYSIPKMRFFEGTANVRAMLFDQLDEWQHSVAHSDFTWWGYQDHELVIEYNDFIRHHAKKMAPEERVWLFSNQSQIERTLKGQIARREIRLVPEGMEFSSTIWVMGDYVVTLMIRQKPHYAFQLKDAVFARNQRTIFQMLWQVTK